MRACRVSRQFSASATEITRRFPPHVFQSRQDKGRGGFVVLEMMGNGVSAKGAKELLEDFLTRKDFADV
jgi:hypothetical protein